jgi:predicted NUDIX family NTP pyrophosphohydrolase
MPDKRFAEAVEIELGVSVRTVASARSAAQALLDVRWPRRGPRHREAAETCLKILEGQRPMLDAHSAFVEAAREAGILKVP